MFGNFAAQAGVISNFSNTSLNIISPTLTWNFNNVLVMDFPPTEFGNFNDRPRINVWRTVNGEPDFNYLIYISGGLDVLSPAPTGIIIQPWGDRSTGIFDFPKTSILNRNFIWAFQQKLTGDRNNQSFGSLYGSNVNFNESGNVFLMGGRRNSEAGYDAGAVLIYTGDPSYLERWELKQKLTGISNSSFGTSSDINNNGSLIIIGAPHFSPPINVSSIPWFLKQKIYGDNTDDVFGWDVDINQEGTTFIVGGPRDDEGGTNAGAALVYVGNSGVGWTLKQKLIGDTPNAEYGRSVAVNRSGTVLMMGGVFDNQAGTNAGAALVYVGNSGVGWTLKQKLTGIFSGEFGTSVAINSNGSVILVGGKKDLEGGFEAGATLIYTGSPNDGWTLKQKLTGIALSQFGNELDISENGDILLIGAYLNNSAFIYTGNATIGWNLKQKFPGSSLFGYDVGMNINGNIIGITSPVIGIGSNGIVNIYTGNATNGWVYKHTISQNYVKNISFNDSGTVLSVGDPYDDTLGTNAGSVSVYTGNADNGWGFQHKILGGVRFFGESTVINGQGNVMVNGNPSSNVNGFSAGSASVYISSGNNIDYSSAGGAFVYTGNNLLGWNLKQTLIGDTANDLFGSSVATNNDGSILVVGATRDSDYGLNAGAAFIYTGNQILGWKIKQKILGDSSEDTFGRTVSINNDGSIIMMSSSSDNAAGNLAGAALVYTGDKNLGWILKQKITGDKSFGYFGMSTAINNSGNILLLGGNLDSTFETSAGAVLIYTGNKNLGWKIRQKLIGEGAYSFFGLSTSINEDGSIITIGANGYNNYSGAAFVYTGDSVNGWKLKRKLLGNSESEFGWSVGMNKQGALISIGGPYDSDNGGASAGAALIFREEMPSTVINAGIDLFTHPFTLPINLNPPLESWVIENQIPGEIKYQYQFKMGESNPQINIELQNNPICGTISPSCPSDKLIVYVGTDLNNCPIFQCLEPFNFIEKGDFYNSNTWIENVGLGNFGIWKFISGSNSFKSIENSNQNDRNSIGNNSFFISLNNTGTLSLNSLFKSGESLLLNTNFSWYGGYREISFVTGNSIEDSIFSVVHKNEFFDSLNFVIKDSIYFGPGITGQITGNAYNKAFAFILKNNGTGFLFQAKEYNTNNILYSLSLSGLINLPNLISGIRFDTRLNNLNINDISNKNYGLYFNNIEYLKYQNVNRVFLSLIDNNCQSLPGTTITCYYSPPLTLGTTIYADPDFFNIIPNGNYADSRRTTAIGPQNIIVFNINNGIIINTGICVYNNE